MARKKAVADSLAKADSDAKARTAEQLAAREKAKQDSISKAQADVKLSLIHISEPTRPY